jgi:hypothetical protein
MTPSNMSADPCQRCHAADIATPAIEKKPPAIVESQLIMRMLPPKEQIPPTARIYSSIKK